MNKFSGVLGWVSAFALVWLMIFEIVSPTIGSALALIFFLCVAQVERAESMKEKKNASKCS